jgi:Na+/H+ antiporter NhaD/arsenite permease-like protein
MSIEEIILLLAAGFVLGLGLYRLRLGLVVALIFSLGGVAAYVALRLTIMDTAQAVTTTMFLLAYGLIASERLHKTTVALGGAVAMLLVGLVTQTEAFHGRGEIGGVDWNTIFLLIGMMIIVNIMRHTGVFEYIAIKSAKLARGEPVAIILLLSVVTAFLSAALDNVTTVLLIAPVTILIARSLKIDPVPSLVFVVLSSNIGGTATLIGDPPNIMIGSSARIPFLAFLKINGPVILVILAVYLATVRFVMGKRIRVTEEQRRLVAQFRENEAITDWGLLRRCLLVFGLTLVGFGLHGLLHLEMATIALAGAAVMMLTHHEGPEEALREVEWPTIFFFIGLFIMVSALVKVGVVTLLGTAVLSLTAGNVIVMTLFVLWFSAIASAFIGNVPATATMTALIHSMGATLHPEATSFFAVAHAPNVYPLWWALSLGACLGGNFTLVGAAANLVGTGISARAGHPISFVRFMKYGVPITLQGLIISSVWLWFLFLR